MTHQLHAQREALTSRAAATLQENAIHNRSALPPFRLPMVAERIVAGLLAYVSSDDAGAAQSLGYTLGRQGLALHSSLVVGRALTVDLLASPEEVAANVIAVTDYIALLSEGIAASEQQEVVDQRQEIERTLERAVQAHQNKEGQLRRVIEELSTPILPIYDHLLVLPLVGSIDRHRAQAITEQLLITIAERQAEMVIIDITGVPIIDTDVANHLLMTTRAVRLLGAQVLLVGISTQIAQTIVHLGLSLEGIVTLANLQSGIEYALNQEGLGIAPLPVGSRQSAVGR